MPRPLALTPAHIARVHRTLPDSGPPPGMALQTDADYAAAVARTLASHPGGETWLFAYGSLIWKPEIPHTAEQPGTARGYHRAFCIRMPRFRGTPDHPGLMLAMDRGGQCKGMLYRLPAEDLATQLGQLYRREFTFKPANVIPTWVAVQTATGPLRALGFVMNRAAPLYAGRLPLDQVAQTLATACGHWGTGAEYLMNTVTGLESRGLCDPALWQLQRKVAAIIGD